MRGAPDLSRGSALSSLAPQVFSGVGVYLMWTEPPPAWHMLLLIPPRTCGAAPTQRERASETPATLPPHRRPGRPCRFPCLVRHPGTAHGGMQGGMGKWFWNVWRESSKGQVTTLSLYRILREHWNNIGKHKTYLENI